MSDSQSQLRAARESERAQQLSLAAPKDPRLALLEDIDRSTAKARELHLDRLVSVLNVARLELKTQIHNVSDDELRMLSMATHHELIIEDSSS